MKLNSIIIPLTCFISLSVAVRNEQTWISINWTKELEADFSFKKKWSYPEGVYRNKFGQLSCDGNCPPEIDRMKHNNGKIYRDSLQAFYQIVDTTHLFHSIKSMAWTYGWAGTDFMTFRKQTDNSIIGQSECSMSTHSHLTIKIKNDFVTAWIDFNSIADQGKHTFPMRQGEIRMDRQFFDQGILKAEFDLTFENTINAGRKIYWKGLIYSKIKT